MIRLKRVYEPADPGDGLRILVERLWPRGMSKQRAKIDHWARDIAPTDGLRKSYGHVPSRWPNFRKLYLKELRGNKEAARDLARLVRGRDVTFVYASREPVRNSAAVLKRHIESLARLPAAPGAERETERTGW